MSYPTGARYVHPWSILAKASRTRSMAPTGLFRFAAHRQPLCCYFMYHSISGSVWYMVRNLRCTFTTNTVFANSKTQNAFLSPVHAIFRHDCPPSGETCKYAMASITQTNLDRFSACWYSSFCCVCLGCCATEFGSSGGTYESPCTWFLCTLYDDAANNSYCSLPSDWMKINIELYRVCDTAVVPRFKVLSRH